MIVKAKKDRELILIRAQNTQNENKAEIIEINVPEEYESFNKKIVFITDDGTVWDVIQNNEYKITNAITKYKQVDFYIWLTKEVNGESIDFRSKTKTLKFYDNTDASDEITPEEIHGVNTVVNILEEEIDKVENLNIEAEKVGTTTTITITKKDGTTESVEINDGADGQDGRDGQDGQDGYTPQKGIDYFTEQDIEEIETDVKNDLEENVLVNYSLIAETGAKIELSINPTDYKLTAILKDKNNNIIHTSNVIDLPLETMVVNATYDNVNKAIILTLQNGTTVSISVADLVSGLVSESQLQTILSNFYNKTEINNLLNNKVDKVQGKKLSSNDFTDTLKEKLEGLENYDDTEIKADISDIQEEQTEQNTEIDRIKATLPTTTGSGEEVTLEKTIELDFVKPPLPRGNTKQDTTTGKNLLQNTATSQTISGVTFTVNSDKSITCNGTATANTIFRIVQAPDFPDNEDMLLTGCPVGGSSSTYQLQYSNNRDKAFQDMGNGIVIQKMDYNTYPNTYVQIRIVEGYTCNNLTFYPMIRLATIEDDTYEPYTGGIPSPNPSYPQEVEVVTGDVEVTISNENNTESKTLPVSLGNIELCKIGDYQDYLYKASNKWYLHKEIKKILLNGTEGWSISNNVFYLASISDYINSSGKICLSDKYTAINNTNVGTSVITQNNSICFFSTNTNPRLYIRDERFNNVNDFKAELSENNVKVYYPTATPTDTEITDATLITQLEEISKTLSYQGQTNITSNTIALFDVKAYQNTKLILEDISDELDTKVSNTDYATSSVGGVIKTAHGFNVSSLTGTTSATNYPYSTYNSLDAGTFISKGTLDSVITGRALENKYSRSEIKTGTWIDNKPVYRRIFTINLGAAPNIAQAHSLTDLDKFWINQGASFVFSSYESLPSTWYYSSADWARTWMTNASIRFRSPVDLTNRVLWVAVEYTKTTD